MKIVGLSGSIAGSKTRTAMDYAVKAIKKQFPNIQVELIDLAEYQVQYSDGRNYMDYEGDTNYVTQMIMEADAVIIGTPVYQASIPGPLKNVFDLLPETAFLNK